MLATKTRYTFADLLEQAPGDETVYDVLGGELVVFSSPAEPHAAVVTELFGYLYAAQAAGYGQVRTAPRAVAFDYAARETGAEDVTHPDLLFVQESRRHILGHTCVEAAPDLVVEVLSPSTRDLDLPGGKKWAIYERYGMPHYWIVDVEARTISQYAWRGCSYGDGRYGEPVVLRPGDTLACPLFPGLTRPVAGVFGLTP
jgi:Uma2 family endonuclease